MTPPAATAAGRRRATGLRPAGRSARLGAGRPPRRVSGPARPAPRGATIAAAAVALPAPRPHAPARPRPRAVPRPARRPDLPRGARALRWLRSLPDHRLLDRLISGRVWIVLLGTLLVGIVTLQLTLLRLNAGIGRAVEHSGALEQRNAALRLEISELSDSERIVTQATQMGYVMPSQGSPRFLTAGPGDPAKALTTMRVPNPAAATADTTATTDTTATATTATAATAATATTATTATAATATTATDSAVGGQG